VFCNISTRPVDGRECMMDCSVELNDTSSAYWIHEEWTNVRNSFVCSVNQQQLFLRLRLNNFFKEL